MPYEVIVVGTDGSDRASVALDAALSFAKAYESTVHTVTVVDHRVASGFADSRSAQSDVNDQVAALDAIRTQATAKADRIGVPLEFHSPGSRDPANGILEVAKIVGADLVIVGNRGMSGLKRVLGSVPNKVSHESPCSVLIVNTDED
jgi:nucleotide-binding universal stress UspA family protein